MARSPRPPRGRRPAADPPAAEPPKRNRSHGGRIAAVVAAAATVYTVGHGLQTPTVTPPPAGAVCGGTERWNVKVANDPDAQQIAANPEETTVAAMNEVLPGPIDQGGRMEVEKKQYAIDGYIAFFKHEDDGDYHVVLTDTKDAAVQGGQGGSMVVELPDPDCFGGHSGKGPQTSQLGQQLAEAKADFEKATSGLNGAKLTPAQRPHVRVTGVAFFDFDHGQTGRSKPHPMPDANGQPMLKQQKVIELHPITQITFLDQVEPD